MLATAFRGARVFAVVNFQVATRGPTQLLSARSNVRKGAKLCFRVVRGLRDQHADPPRPFLLRACRQGPGERGATDKRYELASLHVDPSSTKNKIRISDDLAQSALQLLRRTREDSSGQRRPP